MIYQGILETAKGGGYLWIIWLVAAMFGSILTLASFMKLIHTVFLGQPSGAQDSGPKAQGYKEVSLSMLIPQVILAGLCVVFGIFVYRVPLKMFILPSVGNDVVFSGIWSAGLTTLLIIIGIAIGFVIYLLGTVKKARETDIFVGGERLGDHPDMRVSGVEFYNTIKQTGILKTVYRLAEKKVFDIYDLGTKLALGFNKILAYMHNGVLPTYLAWCLLGMGILFYILLR